MTTSARTLTSGTSTVNPVDVPDPQSDLRAWLTAQAGEHCLRWLLAHTDAGVIWGEYRTNGNGGKLHLSHEALPHTLTVPLSLDWLSVQQARLFSEAGELRLWHDGQQWRATLLQDQPNDTAGCFDEPHLLWGWTLGKADEAADGFLLLKEGTRNIVHASPVAAASEAKRARLVVRHYLVEDDETGLLYVGASRLVKLEAGA